MVNFNFANNILFRWDRLTTKRYNQKKRDLFLVSIPRIILRYTKI